jgi:hypothetical protein
VKASEESGRPECKKTNKQEREIRTEGRRQSQASERVRLGGGGRAEKEGRGGDHNATGSLIKTSEQKRAAFCCGENKNEDSRASRRKKEKEKRSKRERPKTKGRAGKNNREVRRR